MGLEFFIQHPIIFNLIVMFVSLAIVMKAADLLIKGAVGFAQKFGLSETVTGLLIIGIGTSLPEFIAALMGSGLEDAGIIFGTVLGSAVVTVNLVLGIEAVVAKKLPMESKALGISKYFIPAFMALPILLILDGNLSRLDGFFLLGVYFIHILLIWRREGSHSHLKNIRLKIVWKDMFIYLGAFAALLLGARFLVSSAITSSAILDIPSYIVALFVIGIGASIGDLTIDLKSILTGHAKLAIGDLLSGLVTEMLLILGIVALIHPVSIAVKPLLISAAFSILPLTITLFVAKRYVTRFHGVLHILLFAAFTIVQLITVLR